MDSALCGQEPRAQRLAEYCAVYQTPVQGEFGGRDTRHVGPPTPMSAACALRALGESSVATCILGGGGEATTIPGGWTRDTPGLSLSLGMEVL